MGFLSAVLLEAIEIMAEVVLETIVMESIVGGENEKIITNITNQRNKR